MGLIVTGGGAAGVAVAAAAARKASRTAACMGVEVTTGAGLGAVMGDAVGDTTSVGGIVPAALGSVEVAVEDGKTTTVGV